MNYGIPGVPIMQDRVIEGSGRIPSVPLNQPQNIFRFGEQTIWSTQMLPAGAIASQLFRVFSTQLNGTGQGFTQALSYAETNLKEPGRVPNGVAYDVFGVSSEICLAATAQATDFTIGSVLTADAPEVLDALNVQHNTVLSWDFTQTNVDICPMTLAGAGGGLFGALAQNAAGASTGQMNNGNGSIWLYRRHPVALPGASTFAIVLRVGSRAAVLSNPTSVRITLLGYYKNIIEVG
jgi:hypothetical protein